MRVCEECIGSLNAMFDFGSTPVKRYIDGRERNHARLEPHPVVEVAFFLGEADQFGGKPMREHIVRYLMCQDIVGGVTLLTDDGIRQQISPPRSGRHWGDG